MFGNSAAATGSSRRATSHFAYGRATSLSAHMWAGLSGFGCLMPAAASALPIGSKIRLAVVLHERLEEAHRQHLAFAFVDARGEVLVDVVAEHVAVEERAAAVRLHEVFDGRVLLGLAAEDLGDDALHFAAIAAVDEPRAPGHERVAGRRSARPARRAAAAPARAWRSPRRRSCGTWPRGCMLAIISRIVPAAFAQSETRPRLRPW